MSDLSLRSAIFGTTILVVTLVAGGSFVVAAVQGEYGVLRRVQLHEEAEALRAQKAALAGDLQRIQNLNLRLSDNYLDIDLLDERARIILGYLRADEVVIR